MHLPRVCDETLGYQSSNLNHLNLDRLNKVIGANGRYSNPTALCYAIDMSWNGFNAFRTPMRCHLPTKDSRMRMWVMTEVTRPPQDLFLTG